MAFNIVVLPDDVPPDTRKFIRLLMILISSSFIFSSIEPYSTSVSRLILSFLNFLILMALPFGERFSEETATRDPSFNLPSSIGFLLLMVRLILARVLSIKALSFSLVSNEISERYLIPFFR